MEQDQTRKTLVSPIILGQLVLASPTTQSTVGAAGSGSAIPATPSGYLQIMVGNTQVVIPYFNVS